MKVRENRRLRFLISLTLPRRRARSALGSGPGTACILSCIAAGRITRVSMARHGISPFYGQPSHAAGMSLAVVGCSVAARRHQIDYGVDASSVEGVRWQGDDKVDPCLRCWGQ